MDKSPDAFRTISEVAELLDTPAHVLRFWESRFPQIKPVKRAGGRRYYRPADMALLAGIRRLLHEDGLTIRGVQKILREHGVRHVSGLSEEDDGANDIELNVEDNFTEDAVASNAPIALFPALRGDETPAAVVTAEGRPEDEPAPEDVQDDLDQVDEAALLAAIEGAPEEPSLNYDEGKQDTAQNEAPQQVSAAQELPVEPAAESLPEAPSKPEEERAPSMPRVTMDAVAATPAPADAGSEKGDAAPLAAAPTQSTPAPAPPPIPASLEITGHWLPADLRGLRPGAFGAKRDQAKALSLRLEALRNRVGDLGRVPRR